MVAHRLKQLVESAAAALETSPEALKESSNAEEVLCHALVDASGDVEEVEAQLRVNARALFARWGMQWPPAPAGDNCVICYDAVPFIPWGCGHGTCVNCTIHAATSAGSNARPGRGDSITRPAPQLGRHAQLPASSRVPCPAMTTPACTGSLPSVRRRTYVENGVRHALDGALDTERLLAVGAEPGPAQRWRACQRCPMFIAVSRAHQQSAACSCGHITCLDGGAVATNCEGDGHDGLSCAAARDLGAIVQAWAPRFQAAAVAVREPEPAAAPAPPPAPPAPPPRANLPGMLHHVRNLATLSAEPEYLAQLPTILASANQWPLPEGDEAVMAAAEEVNHAVDSERAARRARVVDLASQLPRDAVIAAGEAAGRARAALAAIAGGGSADALRNGNAAIADAEAAFMHARRGFIIIRSGGCGVAVIDAMMAEEARLAVVEASIQELKASLASAVVAPMAQAPALTDEAATEAYLLSESRPCPTPGCGAQLQKTNGCNALEACPNCRRSCCWSCLGPVHDHGVGACTNSGNRTLITAALQAAGRSQEDAQRQADAMAAADASIQPQQSRLVVALRRGVMALENDLLPGEMEKALAPLRAALRLAKLSAGTPEAAADMALLRGMVAIIFYDCCAGARGVRAWHHRHRDFEDERLIEEDLRRMRERERERERRLRLRRQRDEQAAIVGRRDEELMSAPLPSRFAADVNADHDRERTRSANMYRVAVEAAATLGASQADVPATASRLAAAICAIQRAQECARRLALPLLAPGTATAPLQRAQRSALAALRRAAEAERMVNLALLPASVVTPAVPQSAQLLEAAEACGGHADALVALLARLVDPAHAEAVRASTEALVASTEALVGNGPASLVAACGGVEAARARALVAMQPRDNATAMEQ